MTEYLGFWITSSKPSEADNPRWQQATKIDCSLFTSFFCLHQYLRFSRFQPKFCGVLPGCCPSPEKETRISNLWRLSHQNNTSLHKFTAKTPSRQSWNKFYLFQISLRSDDMWHVVIILLAVRWHWKSNHRAELDGKKCSEDIQKTSASQNSWGRHQHFPGAFNQTEKY